MKTKSSLVLVGLMIFASCAENSVAPSNTPPDDNSNNGGNTVNVYQRDVQTVFNQSCAGSGCHVGGSANNIKLGSYSDVMASNGSNLGQLVIPNNADGSPLVQILQSSQQGVARMPLGGSALSSDKIDKIKSWINAGAKNE